MGIYSWVAAGRVFANNFWLMSPTDSKMMGIITVTTDDEASSTGDQLRIWDQQTVAEQRIELDGEVTTVKYSVYGKWIGVFTIPWKDEKPETNAYRKEPRGSNQCGNP